MIWSNMLVILITLCLIQISQADYDNQVAFTMVHLNRIIYNKDQTQINHWWNCPQCKEDAKLIDAIIATKLEKQAKAIIGYYSNKNSLVVSFRGSNHFKNWISNIKFRQIQHPRCSECKIHRGFQQAYQSISTNILQALENLQRKFNTKKVYLTGHSLGGAMAILAGLHLKFEGYDIQGIYTFGQPRVGNKAFGNFYNSQIANVFRVVNGYDIVPHLPPKLFFPYVHFSSQYWFQEHMSEYKICLPETCSNYIIFGFNTNDHGIAEYSKLSKYSRLIPTLRQSVKDSKQDQGQKQLQAIMKGINQNQVDSDISQQIQKLKEQIKMQSNDL